MAVYKANKEDISKDGRSWYFRCYYNDIKGIRKQKKSKKYLTKAEAKEEEIKFLESIKLESQITERMTFETLINSFLDFKKSEIKITSYESLVKKIKKLEGLYNIKISDFNINHFKNWKNELNNNNLSVIYNNNIYKTLRAIIRYGIKYENMNCLNSVLNKMTGFSNSNELKKEMLYFTYEEFQKFIENETDIRYVALFTTLYYCGLRKGEANALTWNDIDFNNKTINIYKSVAQKVKGQSFVILPPKTKSSIRIIPMPERVVNVLSALYEYSTNIINFNSNWYVFGGIKPLCDTSIEKKKNYLCDLIGLKRIRIHDFRHSCASLLINSGASIALVSKYLGHSDIAITLNTYTHFYKTEYEEVIKVINKL